MLAFGIETTSLYSQARCHILSGVNNHASVNSTILAFKTERSIIPTAGHPASFTSLTLLATLVIISSVPPASDTPEAVFNPRALRLAVFRPSLTRRTQELLRHPNYKQLLLPHQS
jgi:hypothetical protein